MFILQKETSEKSIILACCEIPKLKPQILKKQVIDITFTELNFHNIIATHKYLESNAHELCFNAQSKKDDWATVNMASLEFKVLASTCLPQKLNTDQRVREDGALGTSRGQSLGISTNLGLLPISKIRYLKAICDFGP